MAKIIKRTKKDGTCSYCIRVSNGYDRPLNRKCTAAFLWKRP